MTTSGSRVVATLLAILFFWVIAVGTSKRPPERVEVSFDVTLTGIVLTVVPRIDRKIDYVEISYDDAKHKRKAASEFEKDGSIITVVSDILGPDVRLDSDGLPVHHVVITCSMENEQYFGMYETDVQSGSDFRSGTD